MPSRLPRVPTYRAQLAQLVKEVPAGDDWLHEIKYDGYRIGCRIRGDDVQLISRNGKDWTASFPEVVDAVRALPTRAALLDGEIAIELDDGRTSFQALQNAFSGRGRRAGLVYFVFDLMFLDGAHCAREPTEARKERLKRLLGRRGRAGRLRYSAHEAGRGDDMWREACRLGLEGLISKRRDAPYRAGRNADWVKTKCVNRQEFVIGGFTDPEGARKGIGALLVGYYADDRLAFAGKVGTGFTQKVALALRAQLETIERPACPFDPRPAGRLGRHAHWVAPRLVCEVVFTEWTGDGKIRHPSFQGLRADKRPREIVREAPSPGGRHRAEAPGRARAGSVGGLLARGAAPSASSAADPGVDRMIGAPTPSDDGGDRLP